MTPSSFGRADERDIAVAILGVAATCAIFAIDLALPLGWAVWALHLVSVKLALLQKQRWLPLLLGGLSVLFIVLGFIYSPPGELSAPMVITNRTVGVLGVIAATYVGFRVLTHREQLRRTAWVAAGEGALAKAFAREDSVEDSSRAACEVLCNCLHAPAAVVYLIEGDRLVASGGHGVELSALPATLSLHDGLVGAAVRQQRFTVLSPVPDGYFTLSSGLGRGTPAHLFILPLHAAGRAMGAIEVALQHEHVDRALAEELARRTGELAGTALRSALYRRERQALLEQSQAQAEELQSQAEELQAQQEELRVSNEELEEQGRLLRESQASMELQQTELEKAHNELSLHTQALERHQRELLRVQEDLRAKAAELETANRYKSEFLANMSHELRTPLNSSLILSQLLADNKPGNLDAEQVRYARAIHDANNDLLVLINDVLDLAKIEAGHADLKAELVGMDELARRMRTVFEPQARKKGLAFDVQRAPGTPTTLSTDGRRLRQILKNLLANAIKFTAAGQVTLSLAPAADGGVRFEVRDTGVGIAADKHEVIFEAFRQADGSTSRQYGGTGLGLSISRELAHKLGGEITLTSTPGEGSCFVLELPPALPPQPEPEPAAPAAAPAPATAPSLAAQPPPPPAVADGDGRRTILVVEDDARFAQTLRALVEGQGYACEVADTGERALALARQRRPSAILLDVGLPDVSGLSVLERLKRDAATRHIPVHVVSGQERSASALELGAIGHLVKPVQREQLLEAIERLRERADERPRRVLVVEDDAALRANLELLLGSPQVAVTGVGSVADALAALRETTFDCLVTDLSLPDGSGHELLEQLAADADHAFPPVIVYTGRALSRDEEARLRRYSRSIIVKGARSPERLLDEVTLFLHSVEAALPGEQQRMLRSARRRDAVLEGRRVLLAEDDVRNIFALSSVLEPLGVQLDIARNGREALQRLEREPPVDLVLMDIMMPEMDGLAAIRAIRAKPAGGDVPIIALTAKAMADDRAQCLAAGANDYLAKPIEVDRLVSLCRVWMPK
jgi:CheY-like chemotaxis protein/signal transduction histidine kinase